jgi:hypothetical protein
MKPLKVHENMKLRETIKMHETMKVPLGASVHLAGIGIRTRGGAGDRQASF